LIAGITDWAARRLAPYKRPREVIVMPDLPLTLLLKPKRAEIRQRIIERSGTEVQDNQTDLGP